MEFLRAIMLAGLRVLIWPAGYQCSGTFQAGRRQGAGRQ